MSITYSRDTKAVAADMVKEAAQDDPSIVEALQFESENEIRLVYVDKTAMPYEDAEPIAAFYFGADAAHGIPYPSAVALVLPEQKGALLLPDGWGTWNDALSVPLQRNGA